MAGNNPYRAASTSFLIAHLRCLLAVCAGLILILGASPKSLSQIAPIRPRVPLAAEFAAGRARPAAWLVFPGSRALELSRTRPAVIPGELAVKFAPDAQEYAKQALLARASARLVGTIRRLGVETIAVSSPAAAEIYRRDPNVRWVEPVFGRYPLSLNPPDDAGYNDVDTTTPTDPSYATWYKWDAHLIDCIDGWSIWPGKYYTAAGGKGSDAVLIAVIDTGVDEGHPDFMNAGGNTTNVTGGGQLDLALDETIFQGTVTPGAMDGYGHGTHVTGIAAAATNNNSTDTSNGPSTTGNGYNAKVMMVRITDDQGNATDTDLASAIIYAADSGALVCNISLGGTGYSQVEKDAVDYAWGKGMLVVAAAGNDGTDTTPEYPGALSRVLAVSATSDEDYLATYSNYGNPICIAAPGGDFDADKGWFVDVWSTLPTYYVTLNDPNVYGAQEGHDYLEGTSMACPQVVGLAALYAGMMHFTQSNANLIAMWQAVQEGADGVGGPGWDPYYGYGRINVYGTMNLPNNPNPRADTVGCITGQVKYKGTAVGNANIVATPVSSGSTTSGTSGSDGMYRVADAPAGVYNVTATVFGVSQTYSDVSVTAGCDTPGLDFNVGVASGLSRVSVSPSKVQGGATVSGTVTLAADAPSGGTSVTLSSSNTAAANPTTGSVVVAGGTKTAMFTIDTYQVASNTAVTISASDGTTTKTTKLTVDAIGPKSLGLAPGTVVGSQPSVGVVTLAAPAEPGAITVSLSSALPGVAWAVDSSGNPITSITIAQGVQTGSFGIDTVPVSTATSVAFTAAANGVSKKATLKVNPIGASSFKLAPSTTTGGTTLSGTVTLQYAAAPGNITVTFNSSNTSAIPTPGSITIPAGSKSGTLTIPTNAVTASTSVVLSATAGGVTKSAKVTLNP